MHFYTEEPKELKEPAAAEESPDQLSKFKELFKKMQEEEKATKKRRTPTKNKGSNESMQSVGTKKGGKQQQQKQLQQEQRSSSSTTVSSAPGIQKKELAKMVKDLMQKVGFDFYFYKKSFKEKTQQKSAVKRKYNHAEDEEDNDGCDEAPEDDDDVDEGEEDEEMDFERDRSVESAAERRKIERKYCRLH